MSAPRFYFPQPLANEALVLLPEALVQHVRVLRLNLGDSLTLFDGVGHECAATLTRLDKRAAEVACGPWQMVSREAAREVTLVMSVITQDRMDFAIQKATELGVSRIVPVRAARSQGLSAALQASRQAHWQRVVIAAAEQCGRNCLPRLSSIEPLADFVNSTEFELSIRSFVCTFDGAPAGQVLAGNDAVTIVVGPEGGFTDDELRLLNSKNCHGIRLGDSVLRAETAALAALSLALLRE